MATGSFETQTTGALTGSSEQDIEKCSNRSKLPNVWPSTLCHQHCAYSSYQLDSSYQLHAGRGSQHALIACSVWHGNRSHVGQRRTIKFVESAHFEEQDDIHIPGSKMQCTHCACACDVAAIMPMTQWKEMVGLASRPSGHV